MRDESLHAFTIDANLAQMKIASAFKDYYDVAGVHDDDERPFYHRVTRELVPDAIACRKAHELLNVFPDLPFVPPLGYEAGILFFCNRAYGCYKVQIDDVRSKTLFSLQQVIKEVETNHNAMGVSKNEVKETLRTLRSTRARYYGWSNSVLNAATWRIFEGTPPTLNLRDEVHIFANAPTVFLGRRYPDNDLYCTANPQLSSYDFMRVVDHYSAYQEVDMYMGNILCSREPLIEASDELKAHYHGFDGRSFKTRSKKKRKTKKSN